MAFQVSPGVEVKEIDLTNVVPAVSSSIGATVGCFQWGPVEEVVTVGSEKDLVEKFFKPTTGNYQYFAAAARFLQYGQSLRVVRALTGVANATASGTAVLIKNEDHYNSLAGANSIIGAGNDEWIAKYPGNLGKSLKVSVCPADTTAFNNWSYKGNFSAAPGTSAYANSLHGAGADDELHIVVVDDGGLISGVPGTVLETYEFVSQGKGARKEDGTNNYFVDVVNAQSNYVWFGGFEANLSDSGSDISTTATYATTATAYDYDLTSASNLDDDSPTVGELNTALDLFSDPDTIDINLLFSAQPFTGADAVTHSNNMIALAEGRKDTVAFVSPPLDATVGSTSQLTDVLAWANQVTSSSYAVIDSTALYVYDKYGDAYQYVNAAGDIAGLCANADNVADAWFSPAGLNRGQILGVTKIAFNPKKAERDDLYKARVNPVVSFPGEGTVLFGDKTALAKPSAFDRINVRRLFIVLEKAIATASRFQLFEFNDEFTRAQFRNLVEPFLRDVKGRRGITDFLVVCDETNNTGNVIDSNQFVADIYIKPARSINFITLNFIATRTGVEFSEIVGQ